MIWFTYTLWNDYQNQDYYRIHHLPSLMLCGCDKMLKIYWATLYDAVLLTTVTDRVLLVG